MLKKHLGPFATLPFAVILLLALTVSTAFAEEQQKNEQPPRPEYEVSTWGRYQGEADFDDGDASVSQTTYGASISNKYFELEYERTDFDWSNAEDLRLGHSSASTPWDALNTLALSAKYPYRISDSWSVLTLASISANFEDEITDRSLQYSLLALVAYQYSDNLVFRFGGGVSKDSVGWNGLPAVAIEYAYEDWAFGIGIPNTYIEYAYSDELTFRTAFDVSGGLYSLSKNSDIEEKGFVNIDTYLVGIYVDWTPIENFTLTAGPEYYFGRSMQIYDEDGDKVGSSEDLDSSFGGMVSLSYSF